VRKEVVLQPWELRPFLNHADQMAALDYIVAIESDIFIPTYGGNMAKAVEGHRRYLGFKTTIILEREGALIKSIDDYRNGILDWDEFSLLVKRIHEDRDGKPTRRKENPDKPRYEDFFYSNPQECFATHQQPLEDTFLTIAVLILLVIFCVFLFLSFLL
ncbi:GDP-fucose protein O-fucosyltransferase, partial [Corchorus olitorius]